MQAPLDVQVASEIDFEAQKVDAIAREVLATNYMHLHVNSLHLDEDFTALTTRLEAKIGIESAEQARVINIVGEGVGLVDAAFDAMMKAFAPEHISLSQISVDDFSISIKFRGTLGRKSDAYAIALLRMRNSEGHAYTFNYRTPSTSQSTLAVLVSAFAFFINSERAYVQLHVGLEDAKKRNRSDLAQRIQQQMSTLVMATSYKQVVDKMTQKPKGLAS